LQYKRPKNTNGGLWAAGDNQRNLFLRSNSSFPDPLNQFLHSSRFLGETASRTSKHQDLFLYF
jgi:hypothetical protein